MLNLRPIRLLASVTLFAATLHAQTHRVAAPENVTRSVAVWEWTGDLAKPVAARLIPVSLFIEGAFQDGGTYYARPVPLALVDGNIYELDKAGLPQGTITLDFARHLQTGAAGTDDTTNLGWFGYGTYATMPIPRKTPALHASANPPGIVGSKDDDRPTFIRRNTDDSKTAGTPDADTKDSSKKSAPAASVTPVAADDDPDRPHFSKPPATTTPAQTPTSTDPSATTTPASTGDSGKTTTTTKDPGDDTDRPTLRHRDPKQAEADRKARQRASVTAVGSLNDDPDRPNMRRGKTAGIGGDPAPQMSGMPKDLHQIVAVSDPTNREPHPFARAWATPTERADVMTKLEAIAQTQLADYVRTNAAAAAPPPAPAKTKAGTTPRSHRMAPTPPAPVAAPLSDEELTGYTLSYGGLPTFVYTVISVPVPATTGVTNPERYVTLVAQQLPSGELQLAFASVTDAAHLDRMPWFRLVDAVDPDASHRASLLFELRGHSSRQFALYRVISAKADQIFATSPSE
jgi:hypothetical protein